MKCFIELKTFKTRRKSVVQLIIKSQYRTGFCSELTALYGTTMYLLLIAAMYYSQ